MHNLINVLNHVHSVTVAYDEFDHTFYSSYKVFTDDGDHETKHMACDNLPELFIEILYERGILSD